MTVPEVRTRSAVEIDAIGLVPREGAFGRVRQVRRDVLIRALATVVAIDPTNRAIRQVYAEYLLAAGRGPEALEQCAVLMAQVPEDPEVLEIRDRAEELCERTVQAVVASIPDSVEDLIAMWGPTPDVDLSDRPEPTDDLPLAPIGRLSRPVRRLDALGGVEDVKQSIRLLSHAIADDPRLVSLTGVTGFTLYGAPGSGKRTLVEAFAAEIGAECLTVPVDDLLTASLDGRGVDVRTLVDFAARRGRCVVHLQDLEELAAGPASQLSIERARLVEQLAAVLDRRINPSVDLIVVATSSRPWRLPAMLMVPERLGRTVFVPPPDLYARAQMIWSALGTWRRDDVDVWEIARHTEGFSGDDLERVCRTALDRSAATGSGVGARVTTRVVLEVVRSTEPSVARWIAHARLAITTTEPRADLADLVDWLRRHEP